MIFTDFLNFIFYCIFLCEMLIKMLFRGGIAVVWLGRRGDQFFAMKQFPKQGNRVDPSSYIELQVQSLIRKNS